VRYLLKKGAYVNALDNKGRSAIEFASTSGYPRIVELLLGHGAVATAAVICIIYIINW
jgi:ankyrin repeat protein